MNTKSAIELVNEVLDLQHIELLETRKKLQNARENNGHLKMICFWPETFLCVENTDSQFKISNTPTLFNVHDAINVLLKVKNNEGQQPKMKTEISFYELKLDWLLTQIENTQSLLD